MPFASLLAVVAGLCQAVSLAAPWSGQPNGWLQVLSLGSLVWVLHRMRRPMRGAALVWLFSTAWLSATFWWMFIAMHTFAGLHAWLAGVAVLALAAVLSLYYALAGGVYGVLRPSGPLGAAVVFAALWLLAELARGLWFTGFGWGGIAYAHLNGLARSARFVGAYGVCALVAMIAALLACWLQSPANPRRIWLLMLAAGSAGIMAWAPGNFTQSAGTLSVALLQGNIAQSEKFQPSSGIDTALRWYGEQLTSQSASLVVAPETALPMLPQALPAGYWQGLVERFGRGTQAALVGMPLTDRDGGYTNSVVGLKPADVSRAGTGPAYRYDKHHLVPFGEFIPPLFRWFTRMMNIPLGDFTRGGVGQPSFEWQGQRLAPNICYEDLFGEELAQRFGGNRAPPTIFVNVSNVGWFGDTVALDQHLGISRMRSLEFERPFVRATNTGETAIIDHHGMVVKALPRLTRGVLLGEVEGREGVTPYARWVSRWGLWPLWFGSVAVVMLAWISQRRRRSS